MVDKTGSEKSLSKSLYSYGLLLYSSQPAER